MDGALSREQQSPGLLITVFCGICEAWAVTHSLSLPVVQDRPLRAGRVSFSSFIQWGHRAQQEATSTDSARQAACPQVTKASPACPSAPVHASWACMTLQTGGMKSWAQAPLKNARSHYVKRMHLVQAFSGLHSVKDRLISGHPRSAAYFPGPGSRGNISRELLLPAELTASIQPHLYVNICTIPLPCDVT